MLGVYSSLTSRVFPGKGAKIDGTLALLFRPIGKYFHESKSKKVMLAFTLEAGPELQEAKSEGHNGVRKLLLSREWACFSSDGSG